MSYALIDVPGGAETYSVPFPYINRSHVKVMVNGVLTTNFSWINNDTISITPTPGVNDKVRIYRNTSQAERLVDFRAGVAPTETSLDTDSIQAFYLAQESLDRAGNSLTLDPEDFLWDARGIKMKNVAPATDDLDVPLFGQIKPSVDAAQAAQAAAEAARDASQGASDTAITARNDAQAAAALAATFVPDNYYTEGEVDALLANKTDVAVTAALAGEVTLKADAAATSSALSTLDANKLNKSGGTMTGPLILVGDPSANLHAAPKQYVDRTYESAEFAVTAGTNNEFTHDLPNPKRIEVFLRCKAAEGNWSVGDELRVSWDFSTNFHGPLGYLKGNGTVAGITLGAVAIRLPNRTTGLSFNITAANWRVFARVYP